jgi:hypothetical protein
MNDWEKCRNYGHIVVNPMNNQIRLYYNQFEYKVAHNPLFFVVEAAHWQGNSLILRGKDSRGSQSVLLMTDFFNYQII